MLLAVAKSDSYARNENSYYLVDKTGKLIFTGHF